MLLVETEKKAVTQTPEVNDIALFRVESAAAVVDSQAILSDLDLDPNLLQDLTEKTQHLIPLGSLTYNRPLTKREGEDTEGRGVYHTDIPIGNRKVTVYSKGIGHHKLMEREQNGSALGYSGNPQVLVFDSLIYDRQHRRILGTETLEWALLEHVHACVIFAALASEHNWESLEDALEANVTVPVGMFHFDKLSQRQKELLQARITQTPYEADAKQLSWPGNLNGLGSVSLIVPTNRRLPVWPDEEFFTPRKRQEEYDKFKDPSQWETGGRTIRTMLELGLVLSYSSSHGQNMYPVGFMGNADNSDIVFLGDYQEREVDNPFGEGIITCGELEQRAALVFDQITRHYGLVPLAHPVPEHGVSWECVAEAQSNFWQEFLKDIAHPKAIETIPHLIPFIRTQINMAASVLTTQALHSEKWNKLAQVRNDVLDKHDNHGAKEQLEYSIEGRLSIEHSYLPFMQILSEEDRFGARAVHQFLLDGDIEQLQESEALQPYLRLYDAVWKIEDQEQRDRLLRQVSLLEIKRSHETMVIYRIPFDIIDAFDDKHIDLVTDLVEQGETEQAIRTTESLRMMKEWRLIGNHPNSPLEPAEHYFASQLLKDKADIDEVYEQVKFFDSLHTLAGNCVRGSKSLELMPEAELDVSGWASKNELGEPVGLIMNVVGSFIEDSRQRKQLTNHIGKYNQVLKELVKAETLEERDEAMAGLEIMPEELGEEYPELAFAHDCTMTVYHLMRGSSPAEEVRQCYERALAYYTDHYESRKRQLGIEHDLHFQDRERYLEFREAESARLHTRYQDLGFDKIALLYSAKGGLLPYFERVRLNMNFIEEEMTDMSL
ncbi:hypothetical protein ACFL0Y_03070 [Patescibacteria group bacterium]